MNAQWTNFKIVNKQINQAEKLICEQRNSLRRANKKIGNIFVSNKSNPKQSLGLLLLTHIHNSHAHRFSINLKATYSRSFAKRFALLTESFNLKYATRGIRMMNTENLLSYLQLAIIIRFPQQISCISPRKFKVFPLGNNYQPVDILHGKC